MEDLWLDDPDKSRRGSRKNNRMLSAGGRRRGGGALNRIEKVGSFLFPFTSSPGLVAQLSKCEITLCIGNTLVLKLLF